VLQITGLPAPNGANWAPMPAVRAPLFFSSTTTRSPLLVFPPAPDWVLEDCDATPKKPWTAAGKARSSSFQSTKRLRSLRRCRRPAYMLAELEMSVSISIVLVPTLCHDDTRIRSSPRTKRHDHHPFPPPP
jgi:hypothetical protein